MKKFSFTINGNKYDVNFHDMEDNVVQVEVNGTMYDVELERITLQQTKTPVLKRVTEPVSTDTHLSTIKTSAPTSPKGTGTVTSPLPGVILEVVVKEGDQVKIGSKLLVMEAMKMENTINSDKEGTVLSVKVRKGDTVLEGDILVEVGG